MLSFNSLNAISVKISIRQKGNSFSRRYPQKNAEELFKRDAFPAILAEIIPHKYMYFENQ